MNKLFNEVFNSETAEKKLSKLSEIIEIIKSGYKGFEEEFIESVLILLDDENEFIRIKITEISEYMKDERVVDKLCIKLENDRNYFVRGFSAKALGSIGNIKAKKNLESALSDKEGFVVSFAAQALKTINMKNSFTNKLDLLRAKIKENQQNVE